MFKISGLERRKLKKGLSELKSYVNNFWWYHQLDKDMCSFYGGNENYPMSDKKASEHLKKYKSKIDELEEKLLEKIK